MCTKVLYAKGTTTKEIMVGDSRKWGEELEAEKRMLPRTAEDVDWSDPYSNETEPAYDSRFKYDEDRFLEEAKRYIASTYGEHYVGEDKERTQVVDLWESLGSLDTTSRDTAIKYLSRYGKKKGHNKVDLMKAIHYTILLWYATEDKQ